MALIKDINQYKTSRDYELLFELMQQSSIVCIVDYFFSPGKSIKDIASTLYREGEYQIGSRGNGYIWAETKKEFVKSCACGNVEFFLPNKLESSLSLTQDDLKIISDALERFWVEGITDVQEKISKEIDRRQN